MKILLNLLLLISLQIHAEILPGPISSALAGTGRAGMDGAEAGLLNPALVPLMRSYELGTSFRDGSLDGVGNRHAWGVSAGDNGPNVIFPGTLHYYRLRDTGLVSAPINGELIHVAIGQMVVRNVAIGVSGYRLSSQVQSDKEYLQYNYSLGAMWMISQELGVAYVLNNLAKPSCETPTALREDLQQAVGFFTTLGEIARVRLDVTRNEVNNPDHKLVYMGSFESMNGNWGLVRFGYRRDDPAAHNSLTAGFGFNGPRLKFDYAFEKQLEGTSGALHSVDLRLPF